MTDKLIFPQTIIPVNKPRPQEKPGKPVQPTGFNQVFQEQLQKASLKFSQHAQQRLEVRNIQLSAQDISKINSAVDKAADKGAKESLVIMDNLALVVSVKNRVVITAVDGASMKDNVFSNIDSAVFV
ncbi:MAG: flagellar protein [Clostridia bacterium]|nr:flagellar protein [Clostridia bacterium]